MLAARVSRPPIGFPWPRGLPLCFVNTGDDLEVSHASGGRSNPVEAKLVAAIAADVLAAGDLTPKQLAVIAPYSHQCDLVRRELQQVRGNGRARACRIGTVDSFQGQETELVLFSATRSNEYADLGFLQDPRRLCVAITRARRALLVVGDTDTLRHARHWDALIRACDRRGCLIDASEL